MSIRWLKNISSDLIAYILAEGSSRERIKIKNQKIIAKNSLVVDSQLILSLICIHIVCENITKLGKYKFILVGFLSAALSSNHQHIISQSPTLPHTINQLGRG